MKREIGLELGVGAPGSGSGGPPCHGTTRHPPPVLHVERHGLNFAANSP